MLRYSAYAKAIKNLQYWPHDYILWFEFHWYTQKLKAPRIKFPKKKTGA